MSDASFAALEGFYKAGGALVATSQKVRAAGNSGRSKLS